MQHNARSIARAASAAPAASFKRACVYRLDFTCLVSSIKVEVKKKHISVGWNFSYFSAHLIERDVLCSTAPCARLPGRLAQRFGFSLLAVFIASWRRSLSVPKPAKQNGRPCGDHSSIWDSWPIAFSGYPRGTRVAWETRCPKHAVPN